MYNNQLYIVLDIKCTFLDQSSFRPSKIIQTSPPNISFLGSPSAILGFPSQYKGIKLKPVSAEWVLATYYNTFFPFLSGLHTTVSSWRPKTSDVRLFCLASPSLWLRQKCKGGLKQNNTATASLTNLHIPYWSSGCYRWLCALCYYTASDVKAVKKHHGPYWRVK